jgi:nucleotide-binding universal stress UspA family protein
MTTGLVVIGYDGSPAADRMLEEVAALLAPARALVVVVYEPGVAYAFIDPIVAPAPIDIGAAMELDERLYEGTRKMAGRGAELARKGGLDAVGLAVADEITVAATLVRVARERDAAAVAVGAHGHSGLREVLLGSTSRDVVRHAHCPVVVVREEGR